MKLTRCKPFLGTYVEISIDADGEFEDLAELSNKGFDVIEQVSESMSFHDAESELSKMNRDAMISPVTLSDELTEVLKFSIELSAQTDGFFDITVAPYLVDQGLLPTHEYFFKKATVANWKSVQLKGNEVFFEEPLLIDLGGVAKGYAVDLALQKMRELDSQAVITINAGGDLKMSHWQGELAHIRSDQGELIPVEMKSSTLCTSSYLYSENEKIGHIIHPKLGAVHPLSRSVSVFSPCCMHSDALTKVAALMPDSDVFSLYQATILHV